MVIEAYDVSLLCDMGIMKERTELQPMLFRWLTCRHQSIKMPKYSLGLSPERSETCNTPRH